MRLILKRYGFPAVLTLGVYTLLYFLCGKGVPYFNAGFWIAILYAFLMRFTDDILDYERDIAAGKAPIKKNILVIGACVAVTAIVLLSVLFSLWWTAFPIIIIGLLFVVKGRAAALLKPLFAPAVVVTLSISMFDVNLFVWILAVVLIVVDGVLVFKRRK